MIRMSFSIQSRLAPLLRESARHLWRERRGNVMMIFAFAITPIAFATGMTIDYGTAMRTQTKLKAAADAAALSAVSRQVMNWNKATAIANARQMFMLQVSGTQGLNLNFADTAQFNVTITEAAGAQNTRTATVTFNGTSDNMFASILGIDTLTVKGTSTAKASTAPDIDFYVFMDTSPSMALPITSAGLNQMTALTPDKCAFACHSINDKVAKNKQGQYVSYYKVAQSYGIPLRVDAEIKATQDMMALAKSTMADNSAIYRAAVSSFDVTSNFKKLSSISDGLDVARTNAGNAQLLQVYSNNYLKQGSYNQDQDTDFTDLFNNAIKLMPTSPGNGTRVAGDTPQAMMFLVTDGMRDEAADGRRIGAIPSSFCDTIKNRGIRIAILYTEYLPESLSDDWSKRDVAPLLPSVEPALTSCASSGLYYKVTTNDDISAALASLFQKAVQTARLTQ